MHGIPTFDYIWQMCMVNVDKYISPMDAMGMVNHHHSPPLGRKILTFSWGGKYPIIYTVLYIPVGCLGFLPSTVLQVTGVFC